APLGMVTKEAYALQSSEDIANTVFAASGKLVGPLKAPLGFLIVRIEGRESSPGRTLEQVKPELAKAAAEEKRKVAISEFGEKIEDDIDSGATIGDIAKELGLTVTETPALTANGSVYGQNGATAPAMLAKVVPAAFQMDGSGQPQLSEVEAGKTFVIFDVGKIDPAAPPPLASIKAQVAEDARIAKGEAAAKAAADKVKAQIEKGVPVDAAVASLGVALPPVDHVDMDRQAVQKQGKNASRPLLMLFAMAKGKVRLMQGGRNHGWYVVMSAKSPPARSTRKTRNMTASSRSWLISRGPNWVTSCAAASVPNWVRPATKTISASCRLSFRAATSTAPWQARRLRTGMRLPQHYTLVAPE
ncbi:MAG: peptidylprolyl isomerase, partial [Novosphingobium sp.]